jgi:hypothetical protein
MKQFHISVTAESDPVHIAVFSAPNENGDQIETGHFTLPDDAGASEQVVALNAGETLTIS